MNGRRIIAASAATIRGGLLDPTIYANPSDFTDVKKAPPAHSGDVRVAFVNGVDASDGLVYSVRTFGQDASLSTHGGWDDVTGLGSPNVGWLSAFGAP